MKRIRMLFLLILSACTGAGEDPAGTYTSTAIGPYSISSDTLKITRSGGKNYRALRSGSYQLIRQGKPGKECLYREDWRLVWDTNTGTLRELKRGKTLLFLPDSAQLILGLRVYKRL